MGNLTACPGSAFAVSLASASKIASRSQTRVILLAPTVRYDGSRCVQAHPLERVLSLCSTDESYGHSKITTIYMLPDNVLLDLFDHYRFFHDPYLAVWQWHLLAHVCRRWRQIIYDSPRRLDLQILCVNETPVRKNLSIWPLLPIALDYRFIQKPTRQVDKDDVIAALEHPDRVCYVRLRGLPSQLIKVAMMMQKPFPALKSLIIHGVSLGVNASLSADFLGGSAPSLRKISLQSISFPALPTLLSSTSDLVTLNLCRIPITGYISPEAMATCLAALPRLKTFLLDFQPVTSLPSQINTPPITRSVLPVLTYFDFKGSSKYLEALVVRIDGPKLSLIAITYNDQDGVPQIVQLSKFIDRSGGPKPALSMHARLTIFSHMVSFCLYSHPSSEYISARTVIFNEKIGWDSTRVVHFLGQISSASNVVHLKIELGEGHRLGDARDIEWESLLPIFSTVRTLHVSWNLSRRIALELEVIAEGMFAEPLPSFDLIYFEHQPTPSIPNFVTARQVSGRPVTIIDTEAEFDERLKSYVSK